MRVAGLPCPFQSKERKISSPPFLKGGRGDFFLFAARHHRLQPEPHDKMQASLILSDDRDAAHVHKRHATQVMGETEPGIGDLPLPCPPVKLQVHLIQHAQS